jgi:hypothetical protein
MALNTPKPGDVALIDHRAGVQFRGQRLLFRVSRVGPTRTVDGEAWISGYVLNGAGDATTSRSLYVRLAGLERLPRLSRQGLRRAAAAGQSQTRSRAA